MNSTCTAWLYGPIASGAFLVEMMTLLKLADMLMMLLSRKMKTDQMLLTVTVTDKFSLGLLTSDKQSYLEQVWQVF